MAFAHFVLSLKTLNIAFNELGSIRYLQGVAHEQQMPSQVYGMVQIHRFFFFESDDVIDLKLAVRSQLLFGVSAIKPNAANERSAELFKRSDLLLEGGIFF